MNLGAPYTDVRIEAPDLSVYALRQVPGLLRIELHPPASGPEVELVFGTTEGTEPTTEDFIRSEVERLTGRTVLAIRRRSDGSRRPTPYRTNEAPPPTWFQRLMRL